MYEIRSSQGKKPIIVSSFEEAAALVNICRDHYHRELIVTPECDIEEFDMSVYETSYRKHYSRLNVQGEIEIQRSVDVIILGMDLANPEQTDYAAVLKPYIETNDKLVRQYKSGNDKALNALMGIFLKENKGHDAKVIKEALIDIISSQ